MDKYTGIVQEVISKIIINQVQMYSNIYNVKLYAKTTN
jgi:hypothetical protein